MFKSIKKIKRFSEITTIIILTIVAVTSFIIAREVGNQTQELRTRASVLYALVPCTAPNVCTGNLICDPGYIQITGSCGSGVCCKPITITTTITNVTLPCDIYNRLIGWSCSNVDEVFKGFISGCPNRVDSQANRKYGRLYCSANKVKEDFSGWIADNSDRKLSVVSGKPINWVFCPQNYIDSYSQSFSTAKNIIPSRYYFEVWCFVGADTRGKAYNGDSMKIWCKPSDFTSGKCSKFIIHELMHVWQSQENKYNLITNSSENDVFNKTLGCSYDSNTQKYIFNNNTNETPLTKYSMTHCSEALAEAALYYIYPVKLFSSDLLKLIRDPFNREVYKNSFSKQYNFMKNNIFY